MANPNVGSILQRIHAGSHVIAGDHWIWQGNTDKDGYGRFSVGDKTTRVIRAAWEAAHPDRPLGPEDTVDHKCRVESCVNPAHLEPVSRSVNASREDYARAGKIVGGQMHTDPALVHGYHGHRPSSNASGSGAPVAKKPMPKTFPNRFNMEAEEEKAEGPNDSPREEAAEHGKKPPSKGKPDRNHPAVKGQRAAILKLMALRKRTGQSGTM